MRKQLFILVVLLAASLSVRAASDLNVNCGDTAWISATPSVGYHFVRWNDNVTDNPRAVLVSSDSVFRAFFAINRYAIKFRNFDGDSLWADSVNYNVLPVYQGATPTREATAQYTFQWSGWSPALVNATADAVYTATYDTTVNQYTILFQNYDRSSLQSTSEYYGAMPAYNGATPVHPADAQYSYRFSGWSPAVVAVTGAATYTAQYDTTTNRYRVTFQNYDGTELEVDSVEYGVVPTYNGMTPTKDSTAQWAYSFKGWAPALEKVTKDTVYVAQFDSTIISYTVSLAANNADIATTLLGAGTYPYGTEVTISAATSDACYHFTSWSDQDTNASRTITITGNVNLEAIFDANIYQIRVESDNDSMGTVSVSATRPE